MGKRGPKIRPPSERFHEHYEVNPATGCWDWTATVTDRGYGTIGETVAPGKSRSIYAHRLSYEMHHGPIPAGLVVDHVCDNRRCVNPDHLQLLTSKQNILRSSAPEIRRRWLGQCIRGHDLNDPDNVYVRPDNGRKQCRECIRVRWREKAAQRKASAIHR